MDAFKPYKELDPNTIAKALTARTFSEYFYWLSLIAKSLFKWENLPNNMDERWIENYLFRMGACVFFKDDVLGFVVASIAETGPLNYYNDPTTIRPIWPNKSYEGPDLVNGKDAVIIRNNDDMLPTLPTMEYYAYKLTNIERTIDVNISQQKTPLIIHTTDKQKLSYKNAMKKRDDYEHAIFTDKMFDTDSFKVLSTNVPAVFPQLNVQKHQVYNECMTRLGINNSNTDKRERVQSAEVAANDEQVKASEDVMLKARERAAKDINRIFGTDIKVSRRSGTAPPLEALGDVLNDSEGGGEA